jgi:hypothetical protein
MFPNYCTNRENQTAQMAATGTRKRGRSTPDWTIVFDDTVSLRCVVESAAAVMSRVIFKVQKIGEFYFLTVDGADVGYTCCVSARLQLDNVSFSTPGTETSEFTFCVDCKQMLYSIDNPSCSHGCLRMEGHTSNATIHLILSDPDQRNSEDCSELSTFVDGEPAQSLCSLNFSMHLEIDLTKLRDIVKKARKAHAEHLNIRIFTKTRGSKELSLVIFSIKGESKHEQKFCNEVKTDEDGSRVVRAAADRLNEEVFDTEEDKSVFEGTFPIEKIDAFVKNIPVRMIVAKVDNGMPLMLTHKLGAGEDEGSRVYFLVAPRNEDE